MSDEKIATDNETLLFVISAPSGAGKTSLCRWVLERDPKLMFSVSHTTRPPRPQEREGIDYHFIDEPMFEGMVKENRFLEWANVYGRRYGTSRGEIERARAAGKDLLIEIDCQGAAQLRKVLPEAIGIFIVPPTLETLRRRLAARGTETVEEIEKRVSIAVRELSDYHNFQYAVVNDDFDLAARNLESVILTERCRMGRWNQFIDAMIKSSARAAKQG